jgi:hypothetical protein
MKNYLVKSLYQVTDPNWLVHDRGHEENLYEQYLEMHRTSVASYTKHLRGDYELKFFTGRVENISQAFEKTFWNIHQLWHSEPCNIFYTDPDTVARHEINPWSFTEFRMFNFTDPKSFNKPNKYNKQFPYFFNAGVRYFPHSMNPMTWKVGEEIASDWDHNTYDTEQIALNAMLWSQGIELDQMLKPQWAYQACWYPEKSIVLHDVWNGISIDSAAIVHVHSSRNASTRLQALKQFAGII